MCKSDVVYINMPQNRASTTKLLVGRSISIVEYSSSRNPVGLIEDCTV